MVKMSNPQHIHFLDGLRAVAIFLVMSFHSKGPLATYLFRNGGWVGVDVFFVLSGFLITNLLLSEHDSFKRINLKNFYIRRVLRLLPPFLLYVMLICVWNPRHSHDLLSAVAISLLYVSNYDLALHWGHILGSGLELSWSLSVEEQFYMIWPTTINLGRKYLLQIGIACILICLLWKAFLISQHADWFRMCHSFDTKIDALMIGCLSSIAVRGSRKLAKKRFGPTETLLPTLLLLMLLIFVRGIGHPAGLSTMVSQLWYWEVRMPLFYLLVGLFIFTAIAYPDSLVEQLLSKRLPRWLGKISYELYLWHGLVFLGLREFGCFSTMPPILSELTGYAVSVVISAAVFYAVEAKFLLLKERFKPKSVIGAYRENAI